MAPIKRSFIGHESKVRNAAVAAVVVTIATSRTRPEADLRSTMPGRCDHKPFFGLTASATIATPAATISASSIKPLRV